MDDLISRRAMMKEFSDFVRKSNNSDFANTPTWNDAVSLVGSMQSVQPEPHEGHWIPVSERLPETGVEVLTYDEALNYIEIQTVSDGRWENQRGDWQDLDDIAAWMPLPEAYKPNNK
jgi:hypothetical protein